MAKKTSAPAARPVLEDPEVRAALHHVDGTPIDPLEWVVSFAGMDLATLRQGDYLNMRSDLTAFVIGHARGGREWFGWLPSPLEEGERRKMIEQLQVLTRDVLQWVTDPAMTVGSAGARVEATVSWTIASYGARGKLTSQRLFAQGSWRDLFVTRLMFLLADDDLSKLLRCPRAGCGRLFWKVGKKKYCSQRCMSRAAYKRWETGTEKGRTRSKRQAKKERSR